MAYKVLVCDDAAFHRATACDVLKKNGVNCVVRQEHGTDIDAACGQLRSNTMKKDRQKAAVKEQADA